MTAVLFTCAGQRVDIVGAFRRAGATTIVNDRPEVARMAAADGVHLGQTDLPPSAARRVVGEDAIVGRSTHTPAQIDAAVAELNTAWQAASQEMYAAGQQQGGAPGAEQQQGPSSNGGNGQPHEVTDVDYEEVSGDKK